MSNVKRTCTDSTLPAERALGHSINLKLSHAVLKSKQRNYSRTKNTLIEIQKRQ